jgi:hypothetical protein
MPSFFNCIYFLYFITKIIYSDHWTRSRARLQRHLKIWPATVTDCFEKREARLPRQFRIASKNSWTFTIPDSNTFGA